MLYSLKSFKCVPPAANHQINDLPKSVKQEKLGREWITQKKNVTLKLWPVNTIEIQQKIVMICEYHHRIS